MRILETALGRSKLTNFEAQHALEPTRSVCAMSPTAKASVECRYRLQKDGRLMVEK
jgi:hypothetical protein